jgi:hypothetical protein
MSLRHILKYKNTLYYQKRSTQKKNENISKLKSRLYKFYDDNIEKGKAYVANHFLAEGCSRSTIYRHIRSRESGKPVERI